jgi:hypothetical protein
MRVLKRELGPSRDLTIGEVTPLPRQQDRWGIAHRDFRAFLSQFSLRPHGEQLCAPTARFWIFCARVLILIMATAEAVSWGYVGSLFGTGFTSFLTGLAAAMSLFFVIWLVDATFVTMDTSRTYYHRVLSTDDQLSGVMEQRKFFAGLFIRALIVVVSLWITAPFLAQLVFRRDVVDAISSRNGAAVAAARASLVTKYEQQLHPLDSALNVAQNAGILEASGQGLQDAMDEGRLSSPSNSRSGTCSSASRRRRGSVTASWTRSTERRPPNFPRALACRCSMTDCGREARRSRL